MNVDSWLDQYVQRLLAHRIANEAQLTGCHESEVAAIEEEFGISLPSLYRTTLLRFGKRAGRLVDTNEFDFYYHDAVTLNRRIRVRSDALTCLPQEPFFIVLGRYSQVLQYVLDSPQKDDANVYHVDLDTGPDAADIAYPSLTALLETLLQDHLPLPPRG